MNLSKFILSFVCIFMLLNNEAFGFTSNGIDSLSVKKDTSTIKKNIYFKKRITAAALTIALGPLGAHRLYLGTSPHVPAMYVATVGGAVGIIPLIDFFAILFTKDFNKYLNNNKVLMWIND